MPVPFKGMSEYDANFKWIDSLKSTSCTMAPEQEAPRAGLGSANLGRPQSDSMPVEPPIQRKKKPVPVEPTETTKFVADNGDADSYILLGDQSKFGASVRYRNIKNKSPFKKTYKVFRHDHSPSGEPTSTKIHVPVSPPRKTELKSEEPKSDSPGSPPPAPRPEEPRKSESEPAIAKRSKSSPPTDKKASNQEESKRKKAPQAQKIEKPPVQMNAFAQTDMQKGLADSGAEAPADYGMKYRAGVAPKRPEGIKRVSEYQKAFEWRDPVKVSPLLAAEQVVYKSDPSLGPYKSRVPQTTEYEREFKKYERQPTAPEVSVKKDDGASPSKKTKVNDTMKKSVKKSQPTEEDKKALKEAANPQKAFFPHGKHRRTKSEYAANFQPPASYSYDDGAWKGAYPAHIFPQKETIEPQESANSWFQEVLELRRKAEEYRKRAQGTHFSRIHIGQLLAKNAELWDTASESSRTVTAMSLETGSQASRCSRKDAQKETSKAEEFKDQTRRKLAWTEKKEKRDESPPSVSEQGSLASASQKSIDGSRDADASDADTLVEEEIGRIPTPRLRQEVGSAKRHHLDITTPAVGGALLVSPPPAARQEYSDSLNDSLREEPSKHVSARSSQQSESVDGEDEASPPLPQRRVAPKPHISSQTRVIKPKKIVSPPEQSRPEPPCSCGADDEPDTVQAKRTMKKTYKVSPQSAPSPTFGKPTDDNCPLLDEVASTDRQLETEFVRSSQDFVSAKTHTKQTSDHQHRRVSRLANVAIPSTVKEGFGETYRRVSHKKVAPWDQFGNKVDMLPREDDDDDDVLSTSMRSIASSCSLASETLERAAKNRDKFWGR